MKRYQKFVSHLSSCPILGKVDQNGVLMYFPHLLIFSAIYLSLFESKFNKFSSNPTLNYCNTNSKID